jgi:hypothetical protein
MASAANVMIRFTTASILTVALAGLPAYANAADSDVAAVTLTLPTAAVETRPAARPALYLSLAGLQAFDVYSTRAALSRGAAEGNPMVAPLAGNTAGMIAMKAVSAGMTIIMAERLWHRNKAAAILAMVAANGVLAAVAANNARVLHQTR